MKKEYEFRAGGMISNSPESRTIEGLAIPVECRSNKIYFAQDKYFYEIIDRNAVTPELITNNDIKLYMNHDASQGTFARSKYGTGTLALDVQDDGLHFRFDVPNTLKGDELLEGVKRGDYDAVSFAFFIKPDDFEVNRNDAGEMERKIKCIRYLDEISILSQLPAYQETSVCTRALEDFESEEQAMQERIERQAKLAKEFDDMIAELEEYKNIK